MQSFTGFLFDLLLLFKRNKVLFVTFAYIDQPLENKAYAI